MAAARTKTWVWVLVAVGASCVLCTAAGLGLGVLGALAGGDEAGGVTAAPMVMRRFVANGARAHFTSAPLRPKGGGTSTR